MNAPSSKLPAVTIVTDAICKKNPGPGAYAAVLSCNSAEKILSGAEISTTNNRMELTAVLAAFNALKRPSHVTLLSDSRYVLDGITKWLETWRSNGWRTASRKPLVNADLWQQLDASISGHTIVPYQFNDGPHPNSARADEAAQNAFANGNPAL